ncbi:MAG TPA: prolipoprotein diacylglyceryl transferase [Acidimicrobiales bacterium]|nr:prolipoprotein diacylglyceryl transferase [Acidimicrobiales bacterium]
MRAPALVGYIPSPPTSGFPIGPIRLHIYGILIAAGIAAAVWLSQKRWQAIGGRPGTMSALAVWGVPGGLIGARIYSLATSWNVDTGGGRIIQAFEIWRGGLGIWGGVVGGIALGAVGARRAGLRLGPLVDCVAPAFALAQAVGRWGNYFNQELYGWKSNLPWAVKIDSPTGYPPGTTFQPTFLYECIWDLIVCVAVIAVERRFRIRRGYLIAAYAALYTFGRFFTERMRIDTAHKFLGLRLNDWTSVIVFVVALAVLLLKGRAGPGEECAGDPLPAGSVLGVGPRASGAGPTPPEEPGTDPAAGASRPAGSPQDAETGSGRAPT